MKIIKNLPITLCDCKRRCYIACRGYANLNRRRYFFHYSTGLSFLLWQKFEGVVLLLEISRSSIPLFSSRLAQFLQDDDT